MDPTSRSEGSIAREALPADRSGWFADAASWPGIRTFRSERFRLVVGATLWALGTILVVALLARLAADPGGQFGIDFADYRAASLRMVEGRSPYAPEMLAAPVPAQGVDRYRYPPLFAQLLTPVAVLPQMTSAVLWLTLQAVMLYVAAWLGGSAAGAPRTLGRVVWTGVALTYFYPAFDTLWKGNVEGPLALAVGLLLARGAANVATGSMGLAAFGAGAAAGLAALIKVVPFVLVPAVLVKRGTLALGAVSALIVGAAASFFAAPGAWSDYARVVPNLLAGAVEYANNLAPAAIAQGIGAPPAVVGWVRAAAIVVAVLLVVASIVLARREAAWPAALSCAATASLLLPAALWYHYLTVLIPLMAFAWVRAGRRGRLALIGSVVAVQAGLALLPLAALGTAALAATTVRLAMPRASAA